MVIRANLKGAISSNCGGTCLETDQLALVRSPNRKRLTATITGITYADSGEPIPQPAKPFDAQAVGDSFYVEFVGRHLLKQTTVRTSLAAIDQHGNPYWCGDGLAASKVRLCGA
jgi:hypothetical protein